MTDPIAEAAANLNAQPAQGTDPSMFDEIKDTIHDLQEKVEHLIHPEYPNVAAEPTPVAAGGADAAPVAAVAAEDTAPAVEKAEEAVVPNEAAVSQPQAVTISSALGTSSAGVVESAPTESHTSTSAESSLTATTETTATTSAEGNAAPAAVGLSYGEPASGAAEEVAAAHVDPISATLSLEATAPSSASSEDPNAVALPAVEPSESATASSAPDASPDVAMPVASASGVADQAKARALQAISTLRAHFWTFDRAAVAHLHNELDYLEGMFK